MRLQESMPGVSKVFVGRDTGQFARVIFPVVPTNDAAHEAPYYDNPFCVAMWPFCEASTLYGRPECCGGVEPEFKPLRNSMIHTLAPFCCVCMPVSFGVYHFFWAISCCWCGSELPCTIKPVTGLFAKNYPSYLCDPPNGARKGNRNLLKDHLDERRARLTVAETNLAAGVITQAEYNLVEAEVTFGKGSTQARAAKSALQVENQTKGIIVQAVSAPMNAEMQRSQLAEYKKMLDDGLITLADFNAKKQVILFG